MNSDKHEVIQIKRIDAWAFRQPIDQPVVTSFGIMADRPAVFVRIEDSSGCFGWGEIFANWPVAGAEHRVNLLIEDIAELVFTSPITAATDLFNILSERTRIRAIQCGEQGPFRQVIAGLDMALWDLFARKQNLPLRHLLNPKADQEVPAYASGIGIRNADPMITQARGIGFNAFKVKVGFDLDADVSDINSISSALGGNEKLFADANQAWDYATAACFLDAVQSSQLGWIEEPMPVYARDDDWKALSLQSSVPIAGGENIADFEGFAAALKLNALSIYQPDIAKWGGFSGCFTIANQVVEAGHRYCPHFLGGGIGLIASANLLAATGGNGLLEVDINSNILRDGFAAVDNRIKNGYWHLDDAIGLGIEQLPTALEPFQTLTRSVRR